MVSSIWTEKYRPSRFYELVGQDDIVKRVEGLTNSMNIPHLLFAGPAGTGKSSLALIIVKELYGANWRENYLELNASDERGINIVREKVKNFARTKSIGNVPFKIIFLDEADLYFLATIQAKLLIQYNLVVVYSDSNFLKRKTLKSIFLI
jgi:replication factor C small subunit